MKNSFFDIKLFKFIIVGLINTLFSMIIMFSMYNILHLGYWGSSSIAYILSSILSFILNKNFTFSNNNSILKTAIKFSINIGICYILAYSISKPIVSWTLTKLNSPHEITEQVAMFLGMIIFTILNYIGQRFFTFKEQA